MDGIFSRWIHAHTTTLHDAQQDNEANSKRLQSAFQHKHHAAASEPLLTLSQELVDKLLYAR